MTNANHQRKLPNGKLANSILGLFIFIWVMVVLLLIFFEFENIRTERFLTFIAIGMGVPVFFTIIIEALQKIDPRSKGKKFR